MDDLAGAPYYESQGWAPREAGLLLAVWGIAHIPAGLVVPALAERWGRWRLCAGLSLTSSAVGTAGAMLLPSPPLVGPWPWAVLIGLGAGARFPLGLSLITRRSPDAAASAATSGLAMTVGYTVAGFGPLLMGLLIDLTAGYPAAIAVLLMAAAVQAAAILRIDDPSHRAPLTPGGSSTSLVTKRLTRSPAMSSASTRSGETATLATEINGSLARRHSTATVLFHHALADRLGLGPTDLKCLDLLHERAPMMASELAAITGLTTGAITGVVARLERSGRLVREPHPQDRRKQVLRPTPEVVLEVQDAFDALPADPSALLEGFDAHQLAAIAEYLTRATDFAYRRGALLRAQLLADGGHKRKPVTDTMEETK